MKLTVCPIFLSLAMGLTTLGVSCGDKGDGGGAADGGAADGGTPDGGTPDGGAADGGAADGGAPDGGATVETDCSDGTDDDGDGLIDCDDPDCAGAEACIEQDCTDGSDDDGDGLTDCDDPDCLGNPWCPERDCDNGEDDDGDGYADCLDADCVDDPACNTPESDCSDGLDDDGDGAIDCDDSDCARAEGCYEADCADGLDDDGDKAIDCDDLDCFGEDACIEQVCDDGLDDDGDGGIDCLDVDCWTRKPCLMECAEASVGAVAEGLLATGSTAEADDSFTDLDSCGTAGGPDAGFVWEAPADGCYVIDTDGSDFDTVLRVYESCRTDEVACDDDGGSDGSDSMLTITGSAGELALLVVDGATKRDSGDFQLNIAPYEFPYDLDIGSVTGTAAALGDLDGLEDLTWDPLPSCAAYTAHDDILLWTAPSTGTWTFDLGESEFDTVLAIIAVGDRCPEELACNDDEDLHAKIYTSVATVELEAGQQVLIWIGNFWAEELGDWQLDILME